MILEIQEQVTRLKTTPEKNNAVPPERDRNQTIRNVLPVKLPVLHI